MGTFPAGGWAQTSEMSKLARGLIEAATAPQLGDSTIIEGAIVARDETMVERARFGRLTDGTFGVTGRIVGADVSGSTITGTTVNGGSINGTTVSGSTITGGTITGSTVNGGSINGTTVTTENLIVVQGGRQLPLSQLLGQKSGKNTGLLSFGNGGSLSANAWYYDTSLNQTVQVTTGQMTVLISARLGVDTNRGDLTAGFRVTGPTNVPAAFDDGLANEWNGFGMVGVVQGTYMALVTGLANGTYTVCPAYFLSSTGSPAAHGEVSRRQIAVMPY